MSIALMKKGKLKRNGLALRRELSQLASNLVGRPIRVVFERCGGAFTDFSKVVIDPHLPILKDMSDEEFMVSMKALDCHEAGGHLVFTDKQKWEEFITWAQGRPDGIVARNILNILEDARVELACVNRRPGSLKFLRWFNETIVKKTKLDDYSDDLAKFLKGLNMLGAVGYINGQASPEVMDLLEKCRPIVEEARRAKTTQGAIEGTKKILELAKDFIQCHLSQQQFDQFVVTIVDELSGTDKDAQPMPNVTRDTHRNQQRAKRAKFQVPSKSSPSKSKGEEEKEQDQDNAKVQGQGSQSSGIAVDEGTQPETGSSKDEQDYESLAPGLGVGDSSGSDDAAGDNGSGDEATASEQSDDTLGSGSSGSSSNTAEPEDTEDNNNNGSSSFSEGQEQEEETETGAASSGGDEDGNDETGDAKKTPGEAEDEGNFEDDFGENEEGPEDDHKEDSVDEEVGADADGDGDSSGTPGSGDAEPQSDASKPFGGGGSDGDIEDDEEEEFSSLYDQIRQDLERLTEEEEELEEQAAQEAFDNSELLKAAEEIEWNTIHQGVELHTVEAESDEKAYQEAYELVRLQVGVLVSDLRNILERKRDSFITRLRRGRIDPRRAIRDELGDPRIMRRRGQPSEELDVAIQVMIDGSGSMCGRRQLYARMAAILLHLSCQELRIPHSIVTFWARWDEPQVKHIAHVRFEDCFNSATRFKIKNPSYDNARDGYSIRVLAQYLQKQSAKTKILIVLSDGAPNHECPGPYRYMYDKALGDTVLAVREVEASGIKVLGISIGDDHWYMKDIYPRRICLTNTAALPSKIAEVMEEIVRG